MKLLGKNEFEKVIIDEIRYICTPDWFPILQ